MINSWLRGIDGCPAIAATTRARIAIHSAEEKVVSTATTTLRRSTPPGRRSIVSRPAASAVPRRAPIAPKIVPRMPTAAGIKNVEARELGEGAGEVGEG